MFILGFLGIVQAIALPGMIFNYLLKPNGGPVYRLSIIFATSLLFNFILISLLTAVRLYSQPVMLALIVCEIIVLIYLYRTGLLLPFDSISNTFAQKFQTSIASLKEIYSSHNLKPAVKLTRSIIISAIMILAISLIWWFLKHVIYNVGTVFVEWDSIYAWNRWAQIWAQNQFPQSQTHYPNLIPINLSIPYLLMGNNQISFFSKAIMPLFSLLMVLLLLETGLKKKSYGFFLAIIVLYLLIKKFLGSYISEAYADIPLAFFSLITVLSYIKKDNIAKDKKELFLVFLFAAAAAVAKQPGLYMLVAMAILIFIDCFRNKTVFRWLLTYASIAAFIVLIGYFHNLFPTITNFSGKGILAYSSIAADASDSSSILGQLRFAFQSLGKYLAFFILLIPGLFILSKKLKFLTIFVLIPFFLLWAAIASYDTRNLALIFPLLAILIGEILEKVFETFFNGMNTLGFGRIPFWVSYIFALLCLIGLGLLLPKEKIHDSWAEKQKQILAPGINQQLYSLDLSGTCQNILTNYPIMVLPGLEENQIGFWFDDYEVYISAIQDPTICWLLVPPYADSKIQEDITERIAGQHFSILYTEDNWIAYRLIKIR